MKPVISIGNQDFESIRENKRFYIDKTLFIKEWWENGDAVTLITRPRRFGKTLNMSMMEKFFSVQYKGRADLFDGLSIWKYMEYRKLQGSYPVIFLSFASIKGDTFETARAAVVQLLVNLYGKFSWLEREKFMSRQDLQYFQSVKLDQTDAVAAFAIHYLSDYLNRYYGKKVLIFLDEYDAPLQEAYVGGYWDKMAGFIRGLFHASFKTNPYMERGLLTGVTRVGKESIFSDLNNLEVVTTTSNKYEESFGFTSMEVKDALDEFGLSGQEEKVRLWYDGFRFGNTEGIYNPWSITKYLDSEKFGSYWVHTSSNALVGKLIQEGTADLKMAMEDLLDGRTIETLIDEEIVFDKLDEKDAAVWSLLLAAGYLKVNDEPEEEGSLYRLSLTNYEVRNMFTGMVREWFDRADVRYHDFVKALMANDIVYMNRFMNQVAASVFSFFDTGKKLSSQEPERFYHGFVLGLIVDSKIKYKITSNRESGFGRYDVMMEPENKADDAYVLEFKVHDPHSEKTLQDTAQAALQQIKVKNYDACILAGGISKQRIRHYGFAFEGKNVLICGEQDLQSKNNIDKYGDNL